MLTIAVGGLVQVHEIHIDLGIDNDTVELGMEVTIRFLQQIKAADPHFRGRERMHPGNQAGARVIIVGILNTLLDFLWSFYRCLVYQLAGKQFTCVHALDHQFGMVCHLIESFLSIEKLRSYHKPKIVRCQRLSLHDILHHR